MAGRLLTGDPFSGRRELFHVEGDGIVIEHSQDVEDVVEWNKGEEALASGRFGQGFQHKVASIPTVIWEDLMRRGIAGDEKALRKWLNDPENRVFKTKPVRL